jgi:hypothetical protein
MPQQSAWEDEWEDASPVPDVDDDEPTVTCPYCGREIHEESQRCPYCEQYISGEDSPVRPKPWWLITGVALCLLVIFLWLIRI